MPKLVTLPRGVFEKVPGSQDYWIRYVGADGAYHREHCGKLQAAMARLEDRRSERRKGVLPNIAGGPRPKVEVVEEITFDDLIDDAEAHAKSENDPTHAHELSLKFKKIGADFGKLRAASVTKDQIKQWLDKQAKRNSWSDGTVNRYHSAFSLVFRLAVESSKLVVNPAKGIRKKQENSGRIRFLSPEEEARLTDRHRGEQPGASTHLSVGASHRHANVRVVPFSGRRL